MDPDQRIQAVAKRLQSQIAHMSASLADARQDVMRAFDEVRDRLEKAHRLARKSGSDPRSWSSITDVFEDCSSMLDAVSEIRPPEDLLSDPDTFVSKTHETEMNSDEDPGASLFV